MTLPIIKRDPIEDEKHFREFSSDVPTYDGDTPDWVHRHNGTAELTRQMYHGEYIDLPDGKEIEVWGFEDPDDDNEETALTFPSKMIRVREGQLVHCKLKARHGPHTIHWHGIEPTGWNDGVGKLSFEVTGDYTYQWYASESGTYFYHCHRNTTLHFEYGMYGLLIIDPPEGPGFTKRINDTIPYDVEAFWVSDEMDPRWHKLDKDSGIGGYPFDDPRKDPGLNKFDPKYFFITGVPHPWTRTDNRCVVNAQVGQTILVRVLCAGYTYHQWKLGIDAEVIAVDGRPLGASGDPGCHSPYSRPYVIPANTPFELTAARRFDLLIKPTQPGTYPAVVEMRHINVGRPELLGVAETFIHVT